MHRTASGRTIQGVIVNYITISVKLDKAQRGGSGREPPTSTIVTYLRCSNSLSGFITGRYYDRCRIMV